jgi:VWFA-related protein
MKSSWKFAVVGLVLGVGTGVAAAQDAGSPAPGDTQTMRLDVVVTDKSNKPVGGLGKDSFSVLDAGVARPVESVSQETARDPLTVVIVVDAVNTPHEAVAYQRDQIVHYLRSNDGALPQRTTFAVLTDKGVQIANQASKDGKALGDELEHYDIGLRVIGRDQGFYGAQDRLTLSLNAVRQIIAYEAKVPGRKLVLWVSPGWPLLSGVEVQLDGKQQAQIYRDAATFSTQLRQAGITLYSINSWGVNESVGRANYYLEFTDGLTKPSKAQLGDLGLQVMAVQSGGLVLNSSDVAGMLRQCVQDADESYLVTFQPAPSDHKGMEFHPLKVEVPGYKVRTRQGYYTAAEDK